MHIANPLATILTLLVVAVALALPMSLKPAIERAQAGMARSDALFERYLEDKLTSAGLPPGKRPPRFQHALDVMRGRAHAQMDLQRPKSFYFPGLPQRRYYERSEFEWAPAVEAAAGAMLAMAPVILIGLAAQRHIVKGLTVGAVKGGGRR